MPSEDTGWFVSRTMSSDFFVEFRSVVRGYHVYRAFECLCWVSYCTLKKNLTTQKIDILCMSVLKSSTIVGHIVITKRQLKIILSTFGSIF